MKELSLNILDIAQNSLAAGARHIRIELEETEKTLSIAIGDDGWGMDEAFLKTVTDPFSTSRTTRKVGLGLPLFKMAAEQTGGWLHIASRTPEQAPEAHGTLFTTLFHKEHMDFTPLGDMVSTLTLLLQGNPEVDIHFSHTLNGGEVSLDTGQMREVLGPDIPLNSPEVLGWVKESLLEGYRALGYVF